MFSRLKWLAFLKASFCFAAGCDDDGSHAQADSGAASASTVSACGKWELAHQTDRPPAAATAYGMEYNPDGNFSQYVCRFRTELDGKSLVLQGKGVYGYSCYAVLPAGVDSVPRMVPSSTFEVLTDTESCAQMVPFQDQSNEQWLPTGTNSQGEPTYSCRGVVKSLEGGSRDTSLPLGRYEPETKRCVFEWYTQVRAAPAPGSAETFEMLAVPQAL